MLTRLSGAFFSSRHLQQLKFHGFHTNVSKLVSSSKHSDKTLAKSYNHTDAMCQKHTRNLKSTSDKAMHRRTDLGRELCCGMTLCTSRNRFLQS